MRVFLRCAVAIVCGVSLLAQTPLPQGQAPTFRTKVNAVTLDVTVLSKSGEPVTDLTADDFEIVEQGKPQKVEQFELVDMDTRPPLSSNLYHDVRTMESLEQEVSRRESRLIVVFLNDYHVRRIDQYQVQLQVADVVRNLDPRDLVAIMTPLTPVKALSFSRDHDADARTIAKFEGRQGDYFSPKGPIEENMLRDGKPEQHRRAAVWTALEGLCTYLGTLRDTRKSVLFVSTWAPGGMGGFAMDEFNQVQRAAAKSNTAFYTYDPRGLMVGMSRNIMAAHEWLQVLAEQTGGRAIVNTNDGRRAMASMISDSAAYYLVGYSSTEDPRDGKFHNVKVRVKRPGVEVRARSGYWAMDAEALERLSNPPPPPVDPAINAALDMAAAPEMGRAVRAWAGVDRDAAGKSVVTIVWESSIANGSGAIRESDIVDRVDVTASSAATSFRGRAPRDAAAATSSGSVTFAAAAGALDVRLSARSADNAPLDTAMLTVAVPSASALGTATPVFFRGRTARDVTGAAARPTALREFRHDEVVAVRAHGWTAAGDAPQMSARLLSDHGELLLELDARPVDGATGTVDVALPVSALGLGRYVVEIVAEDTIGGSVRQLAAFRVR